jgi:hypothetical protein
MGRLTIHNGNRADSRDPKDRPDVHNEDGTLSNDRDGGGSPKQPRGERRKRSRIVTPSSTGRTVAPPKDYTTEYLLKHLCPLVQLRCSSPPPYSYPTSTEVFLEDFGPLVELYYSPLSPYSCSTSTKVFLEHLSPLAELYSWPKPSHNASTANFPCLSRVLTRTEYECNRMFDTAHAAKRHAQYAHLKLPRDPCPLSYQIICIRDFKTQHGACQHARAHSSKTVTRLQCSLNELKTLLRCQDIHKGVHRKGVKRVATKHALECPCFRGMRLAGVID